MPRTLEHRMKALEEMITEIHAVLILGKTPAPLDAEQWRRAFAALLEGDKQPLSLCLKRSGGHVPKTETIFPDAAEQRGGSVMMQGRRFSAPRHRSANLPTTATLSGHAPGH